MHMKGKGTTQPSVILRGGRTRLEGHIPPTLYALLTSCMASAGSNFKEKWGLPETLDDKKYVENQTFGEFKIKVCQTFSK